MRIRAALHLNNREDTVQLYQGLQETEDHQALKLAAAVFFFDHEPSIVTGAVHGALAGQDYWPDLMKADLTHQVLLWVECGKTTPHKLEKITRRFRSARVVVLTATPQHARQQMEEARAAGLRGVEAWSFKQGEFKRWRSLIKEKTEVIGEADEQSMHIVINDELFETQLERAD